MASRVLIIVGARLNSSRLPGKHLLDLAGESLITRLKLRLEAAWPDATLVLATTSDDYNAPLVSEAGRAGYEVCAYDGDVNDLVGRVDAAVRHYDPEVVCYICGDCPLIEPTTLGNMIASVAAGDDMDVAKLDLDHVGGETIHEGFAVYSRQFWDAIVAASQEPFEREHVGVVYGRLGKVSPRAVAMVPDDPFFSTLKHRISVDTPADYAFMKRVYEDWYQNHEADEIVDLKWVISRLKEDPSLGALNAHVHQKDMRESSKHICMLVDCREGIGLGHLSRCRTAAEILRDRMAAKVSFLMIGEATDVVDLQFFAHEWLDHWNAAEVGDKLKTLKPDLVFADFSSAPEGLDDVLACCKALDAKVLGFDRMVEVDGFDGYYVPSFYVPEQWLSRRDGKLVFGWDCYLLPNVRRRESHASSMSRIVVLTGSTDVSGAGEWLPAMMDAAVPASVQLEWVQGPRAPAPQLESLVHHDRWSVLQAPDNLSSRLHQYDGAVTLFGMSFFECVAAGLPTVVFDPIHALQKEAWQTFAASGLALAVDGEDGLPDAISKLAAGWQPAKDAPSLVGGKRGEQLLQFVRKQLAA
ncbi:cytidylyltransferase domain-containing protein [Kordiimonas sp.]|uniref:cytidylyltransferase domain-containing protein n=1 Tax=Kordiimonas sp. TaxID=1970157 RepID=UPI003A905218